MVNKLKYNRHLWLFTKIVHKFVLNIQNGVSILQANPQFKSSCITINLECY